MVSFHTPLSPTRIKMMPEFENLTKKRKWEESQHGETSEKQSIAKTIKPVFDTKEEPHLETPLPLEWQRCLDIKSGQLYFYNTRTHKRTSSDPRIKQEPLNPGYMSLDLQLNLPCGSVGKKHDDDHNYMNLNSSSNSKNSGDRSMGSSGKNNTSGLTRSPSWLTIEGDQREMVTAVCKKCHMLVIMCKSCPSCPNCKFVHPPNQSPPGLFDKG